MNIESEAGRDRFVFQQEESIQQNLKRSFSPEFKFGSSVSAFQVEGNLDGTRRTNWDVWFEKGPEGSPIQSGEIGPNWWTPGEAEKDFERLAALGMEAQRFGIEWARIEPEQGQINQEAIKRYHGMLDSLKNLGIEPMITLNHFSIPEWLAKQGGWENKSSRTAFKAYAERMVDEFGDVPYWITINEPANIATIGYLSGGEWPPGRNFDPKAALSVMHNVEAANNEAYEVIKKTKPEAQVGSANYVIWFEPDDPNSKIDRAVAKAARTVYNSGLRYLHHTKDSSDFIGIDFYTGFNVRFNPSNISKITMEDEAIGMVKKFPLGETVKRGDLTSDMGWPIAPDFFLKAVQEMYARYKKPIIITENGIADRDDGMRSFYLLSHLVSLHEAVERGVDVRGYYHWSSVDNLEWMEGYGPKFGLISVDSTSGERTIRQSAELYKEIAKSHEIDVNRLAHDYLTEEQIERFSQFLDRIQE